MVIKIGGVTLARRAYSLRTAVIFWTVIILVQLWVTVELGTYAMGLLNRSSDNTVLAGTVALLFILAMWVTEIAMGVTRLIKWQGKQNKGEQ